MRRMNRDRKDGLVALGVMAVITVVFAVIAVVSGSGSPSSGVSLPDRSVDRTALVEAAGLSGPQFTTCWKVPNEYGISEYNCSGIVCDVALDVPTRQGGVSDFYYCHQDIAGCTVNGYCPGITEAICVTGHGRRLAVNQARTDADPGKVPGGPEPSCPYHDEQYGQ